LTNIEIKYKHFKTLVRSWTPHIDAKTYTSFLLTDYNLQITHQYHIFKDKITTNKSRSKFIDADKATPSIMARALLGI